ncbi:MAG TPA: hypothetical protein VES79_01090 [Solirubrobacteraceae bacterium]|nr:hypothetical protein [Solirubrobacteraceae bacterium]
MPAALVRDRMPYPLPPLGAPLRVAFLGPAATVAAHALHLPAGGVQPRFIDVRADADAHTVRAALRHSAPHVVVALAPDVVPPDALVGVRAATLAVASSEAAAPDAHAFDRVLRTPGPGGAGAWRSRPLPIDDGLYAAVRHSRRPPRALYVGRSTEHREWVLAPANHEHDVVHYAHGLTGSAFTDVLAATDIGVALHPGPVHGFPPQALLHLAAGQLLLAERLAPACGLEPGIDFLEIQSSDGLVTMLYQLRLRPDAYDRVRVRGRLKAEGHRASRVWPRIIGDLLHDIRVFGTARA